MKGYKIVYQRNLFWYWKIVSKANGQVLATSETYFSKASGLRTAEAVSAAFSIPLEVK